MPADRTREKGLFKNIQWPLEKLCMKTENKLIQAWAKDPSRQLNEDYPQTASVHEQGA